MYILNVSACVNSSNISSTESDANTRIGKAVVMSVLLYGCTTWTLTKHLGNKLDGTCTRMMGAVLNKSWKQHPTRKHLYGHLLPPSHKPSE